MFTRKRPLKIMIGALTAALLFTAVPHVASAQVSFDDVHPSNAHYDSMMELAEGGVFNGSNGKFKPYDPIMRGQVAAVMSRALLLDKPNDTGAAAYLYDDVSYENEHLDEIATVLAVGIFKGSNNQFKPYDSMTREQMATVIAEAFSLKGKRTKNYQEVPLNDTRMSDVHRENVQIIANHGITTEVDNFRAYEPIQRDQFASFLTRAFYAVQRYRH